MLHSYRDQPYSKTNNQYEYRFNIQTSIPEYHGAACESADCIAQLGVPESDACMCYGVVNTEAVTFLEENKGIQFSCMEHSFFTFFVIFFKPFSIQIPIQRVNLLELLLSMCYVHQKPILTYLILRLDHCLITFIILHLHIAPFFLPQFNRSNMTIDFKTPAGCPHLSKGISFGTIALIIIGSSLLLFFVIGILINALARGKRGLEMIPFFAFWKELPRLILDGLRCIFSPCCRGKTGYSDYKDTQ